MSLDTSFYYRLTNKFQGPGQSLDVHSDGSRRLKMASTANFSGQHWRLVDLGNGKYALRTEYLDDCFSLDVINDVAKDKPWLNTTGNFTGQFWSLTPWGDGSYKLSNDFTGAGKSLNVFAQSFELFMGTGDHSGQHWVLTPLTRISRAVVPELDPRGNPSHNEGPSDYNMYCRPIGTLKAVMLFVDFSDAPAGSLTTQQAADQVLGRERFPAAFVKRYAAVRLFNEQSYGKLTLDVDIKSDLGWRRMPKRSDAPEYDYYTRDPNNHRADHHRAYIEDAAKLFTPVFSSPKVIFAAYNLVYIVAPPNVHSPISPAFNQPVTRGARTLTGEIRLAVTLGQDIYKFRYITLVHETGHLFDLPDLYVDNDPGAVHSKVGPWDIMSDTFRAGSFLGWHRHKNGWLDAARKLYISQTTPRWDLTLSPLSGTCGTSMVVLPIDNPAKPSKVFVIELAPPILGQQTNTPRPAKGVLVYTVDATIHDLQSPVVINAKTADSADDTYGLLRDAAYDVGDHMSWPIGGTSLAVTVNQKIGDCYNISISYSRP